MKKNKFLIHNFFCTKCGTKMPLPRMHNQMREGGHLKNIYCYVCKQENNFVECNDITYSKEDFFHEKQIQNFSESGKRKEHYYGKTYCI